MAKRVRDVEVRGVPLGYRSDSSDFVRIHATSDRWWRALTGSPSVPHFRLAANPWIWTRFPVRPPTLAGDQKERYTSLDDWIELGNCVGSLAGAASSVHS
jgi:hypothetical protein